MFKSLSVSARFLLVLAIGFTIQAGISINSLQDLRTSLIQDRVAEVKHLLDVGFSTVVYYHGQFRKGAMAEVEAQTAAKNALRAMHYDGANYFFVWDLNGTGIAHGSMPALEGKTFIDSPAQEASNPVVAYMVHRLIEVARSPQKEGVTTYRIPKSGQKVPLEKIAYSRLFEPWGWSIGTGAYVDDIDTTFRSRALSILCVSLTLMGAASLLTYVIGRDLAQAINRLSRRVVSVARGELGEDVPDIDRRDEVGAMARALLILRDTSREAAELRLDHLTGLPTRRLLMDRLNQAKARSSRSGQYGALIVIDMDRFKILNDTHGHDMGDLMLREVAERLKASVREGDTVARLGGDEFISVIVDIGQNERDAAAIAEKVGEKMLAVLNQIYHIGSIAHTSSASLGVTLFRGDGIASDDVIKQADLAMYKAKEAGRNAVRFFDPDMETAVKERMQFEKDLSQAWHERQFELHFQPQIDSHGAVEGAEALLRWRHPRRGLVMPGEFIALAEDTGLIQPLGQWALEGACLQLALWAARPQTRHLKMAVNVSAKQFHQTDFVDKVLSALQDAGASPGRLMLELTESVLVRDVSDVIEKMARLKRAGVGFALDDFGTGYSSLAYLKRLPLKQLKIDRSFVSDILVDENDASIAKMIITLAHSLELEVVAEGVETRGQLDVLTRLGCNHFQGYLFSRPVPIGEFEALLTKAQAPAPADR